MHDGEKSGQHSVCREWEVDQREMDRVKDSTKLKRCPYPMLINHVKKVIVLRTDSKGASIVWPIVRP